MFTSCRDDHEEPILNKSSTNEKIPKRIRRKTYECESCQMSINGREKYVDHCKNVHNKTISKRKGFRFKFFECESCQMTIYGREKYVDHCKNVHNKTISRIEMIKCDSCAEEFMSASSYIKHHQSIHGSLPSGNFG